MSLNFFKPFKYTSFSGPIGGISACYIKDMFSAYHEHETNLKQMLILKTCLDLNQVLTLKDVKKTVFPLFPIGQNQQDEQHKQTLKLKK